MVFTLIQLNINKTCFVCSEGSLKIIGDAARKHHDKNISDNRLSITVLCCGSAAGTHGPVIFIMKGTEVNRLFSKKNYNRVMAYLRGLVFSQTRMLIWMMKLGGEWWMSLHLQLEN